jgi:membrane protease subunit HflK
VLSTSSKVLVDVQGGNNMLYLPLDRIVQQTSAAPTTPDSGGVAESIVRNAADRGNTTPRPSR